MQHKIAILGAGKWGQALGTVLAASGHEVVLWSHSEKTLSLPVTTKIEELSECNFFFIVVPAQTVRQVLTALKKVNLKKEIHIILCSKGIEDQTLCLMTEITEEIFPNIAVAVLSGPNFAHEIMLNLPTTSSVASTNEELNLLVCNLFTQPILRLYPSADPIALQIFGAGKNVLAIACGIHMGKGLGDNGRAAMITRGINELQRLSIAKGGKESTILEPGGIGDIILTCTSKQSRNIQFGMEISQETIVSLENIKKEYLVEGIVTTKSLFDLSTKLKVEMPICHGIYRILHEKVPIPDAIRKLMQRHFAKTM